MTCGPSATVNSQSSIRTSLPGAFGRLEQAAVDLALAVDAARADGHGDLGEGAVGDQVAGLCGSASFMSKVMVVILSAGGVDLAEQRAEVRRLGHVEPAGAVLGRQPERIAGPADEAAVLAALRVVAPAVAIGGEQAQRDHLVDDAGQLARRPCRPPSAAAR